MLLRLALMVGLIGMGTLSSFAGDSGNRLEAGVFNSSSRCGVCHAQIYDLWKRSLHAGSVSDPIFDAAYTRAYRETAGAARKICLRCHAPVAYFSGDLELQKPISREGVTCDFCHSVTHVDLQKSRQPFRVRLDGVKRGPRPGLVSPVHGVELSKLHESSTLCAGCHEYANQDGLLLFSTYSEWKVSPQAKEGKTCQYCHMPVTKGMIVIPGLGSGGSKINLHNISGGHSSTQVRKAASLKIVKLRRSQKDRAELEVLVSNVGSGHSIPTGMPTRKLQLDVELFAGNQRVHTFQRDYQRVLLDRQGRPIRQDHRVLLDAVRLLSDTRLRPGEKRLERFVCAVPSQGELHAVVRLRYVYEPELLSRQDMNILMVSDEQRE